MGLSIVALVLYIFGAYGYGYLLWLSRRQRHQLRDTGQRGAEHDRLAGAAFRLFLFCAAWFVLHVVIEFGTLLGKPRSNDWLSLAALELVFLFPAVIFHTYLTESVVEGGETRGRTRWTVALAAFYVAGISLAAYFTAAIFQLVPQPPVIGRFIGIAIGLQFTLMSVCAVLVRRQYARHDETHEQQRFGRALNALFGAMVLVFIAMIALRDLGLVYDVLLLVGRATPLAFLIVSSYFENRVEFYDLIIKRGVLLLLTLLLIGTALVLTLEPLTAIPDGPARPWIFAIFLLPIAMLMPWLHDRVGRVLDRLWFGRDFTPIEAVKHVLGAMQEAADEASLIASTEDTLSEMFRRRIVILTDGRAAPDRAGVIVEIPTRSTDHPVRVAVLAQPGVRAMLSEDVALLQSLGAVFGDMLDNVRLQHKRQEQEQVAQQLRLQTSRSELKALRAQINPHFLFNALNAIASLIHTDPLRADAAVEQLADVFRYTLRRSEQEWAPLDQELDLARAYLEVEQARFGKRLEFAIHAAEGVARAHVPSMLLQTLVENAVKHGISQLRTPGRIDIHVTFADHRLRLEVRDTGPGPAAHAATPPVGESFGLRSVRDRLHGHFGANGSLGLHRAGDVTVARIDMPLVEDLSLTAGAGR